MLARDMGNETGESARDGAPANPSASALRETEFDLGRGALDATGSTAACDATPPGARAVHPVASGIGERTTADHGQRLHAVRSTTVALAAPLSAEDCQPQSMPDASPVKWHLAHTTWFFDQFVLAPRGRAVAPDWSEIFNSYYVGIGPRHARPRRGLLTRPTLDEVLEFRARVDERLGELITGDATAVERDRIELGLNHEQQHQELILMDVLHLFSNNPLAPAYAARSVPASLDAQVPPSIEPIEVPAGLHVVGRDPAAGRFVFDNETPAHRVFLEAFALASRPSSCAEYAAFIDDGGYERPELWTSDGWDAVQREGWSAPLYWSRTADGTRQRFGLTGRAPLVGNEPVQHLSWYEADAFARWSGARLPREHEWEVAIAQAFPKWCRAADLDPRERPTLDPGAHVTRRAHLGPRALLASRVEPGDGWEWTASDYAPYPGFAPLPGALGEYNGKFMSGQLVLRGGSFATAPGHTRASYRNFFWHAARWPFTGVRLAWDR
ncbi:Iron(II)-dependent oxidoreductase EgtB [Planctomycetes bacterium Pla163]|uniref:Iron(II)-dependent oxidoreductase EgtB n=2 Tax=Rohdeia mirabilis TaxID=2528008 RepID=A0A518D0X7_9BACT|nr:Iron(II)-dependent oxidoreductase EgtB [Planctomycetes bacterium Pla163]